MNWFILSLFLSTCGVMCDQKELKHNRVKRWDHENHGVVENTGDKSENFRGTAGVDYPDYKTIPQTNFRCDDQLYEGGMYADVETQCQVYHVCHDSRMDSFICGRGTIFNQEILACDYWYSTDCSKAPSFYYVNSQIGNSGSSWQGESPQQGHSGHYQIGSYAGGTPNLTPHGSSGTLTQPSGPDYGNYKSHNPDQKDCCCPKQSNKSPWAFPSS